MAKPLTIRIASDFVCPWCLLGHKRLEMALENLGLKDRATIEWLPYQLNAAAPEEGFDRKEYMTAKFGGPEKLAELDAKMREIGEDSGITFRQDLMKRVPNTFKAHRLNWFAAKEYPEKADALATRLLEAYFTEGKDTGDNDVLASLAAEVGIDKARAAAFLKSGAGADEVRKLQDDVRTRGVNVVPTFFIGNEEIRGAIGVDDMEEILKAA